MAKADKSKRGRAVIAEQTLKKLLRSQKGHKDDVDEIVGTMRSEIANAVENNHLNKKIFGWIKQLDKMEPEKLALMLDDLEHYLDISGLNKRASDVQDLDLKGQVAGEDDDEGEGEETGKGPKSKVRQFPKPSAVAAE